MTRVGDVVRVQTRIKGLYRSRGFLVSGENVYGIRHRAAWQKQLPSHTQTRATRLYAHLDFLLEQKNQAEADLLREAKKHPIVRTLETAPGFGPIRAARLVPIVVLAASRLLPSSLPNEASVLGLLRPRNRDPLHLGLGPVGRGDVDQDTRTPDEGPLSPAQPLLEEPLQGRRHHGDYTTQ